jgi:16S rRNA (cytidine1402-2'-O)-methyltransferase
VLTAGQSVAYVSDGGTPGIADPGRELVSAALGAGVPVIPIPGPCALVTALSVSGMVADRFVFGGFPPRKAGERREFLLRLGSTGLTVVLYEAPHRIVETLEAVAEVLGDPQVMLGRELTKQYEELLHGRAAELAQEFRTREPRGEFVIVVEGSPRREERCVSAEHLATAVQQLAHSGVGARDISQVLSGLGVCGRREAYQMALAARKELAGDTEN